ncbi:SDR family NAD(P)-dependent oxidoreductase [Pseudomonas sp. GD04087]|uniref:SDR family NAD(P)-dependent oxidoreductase n=1 Tax=unclassified Pseudomonas TaxID=196821 RepID=UPI00244A3BF0|nr:MULTISPECIES: SDR family NAD(P)-dependent oxidoreductase [unclassified Pseudomonas]MDH0291303.1 SDR family NAD(P)-dependent oxidoreductase [Pseudomonas sp. GD04087]MDH1052677.1 SDR family NAD(P)-dependent oxidoreductase [Pseudomonas sp. GD03903]MDH2001538.1 SDR family NAD(P)-dependent oxidoreductase [Pseudomonas sp. GD03691]
MTTWIKGAPKVAFISGAGSGIGLQIAKALLNDGASLALFDLRVDDAVLETLRRSCFTQGQRVEVFTVDISQAASVDSAIDAAVASFGAPDFAFNSAGILRTALFTELPAETFELVIRINLIGSRNFAAGILRYMKPGGHLALVASLAGIIGGYTQAAYGASKFGVVGLAEVLRLEQKPCGIDVSVICPGEISTPLLDHERQHGSKVTEALNATAGVLTVEQAVAGILQGLRKREFMITPGFRARFLRGMARKASGLMRWMTDKTLAGALADEQKRLRKLDQKSA